MFVFCTSISQREKRSLQGMSGTQATSAVSVGFISLESHEAVKARMEAPFPTPRGYNPGCWPSCWPPTPRQAWPVLAEDGQAALPELLPRGLDCRWSVGAVLPLSPLGSIPSGRNHRPQAARRFKDVVCPYLNWEMLEKPSQPSGFSIRLLALFHGGVFKVRKRPWIPGVERKELLAKHIWFQLLMIPRISQIFAEG